VIKKYGFKREDMLIIGDRLNTDIKMANENEISSIWVTNNLKDPEKELKGSGYKPDVTIDSIALLYKAVHNI
jgi:Predicted sugar phosphatases of the HAD superfamily